MTIEVSRKANIKHHFIPQCYLRNFSDTGRSLWTYDKISSRIYNAAIDNVCCFDNFYKLSDDYIRRYPEDAKNSLTIECDYFSKHIEPAFNTIVNTIIDLKNEAIENEEKYIDLSFVDKFNFARYIVIQYFRLPSMRNKTLSMIDSHLPQIINMIKDMLAEKENNPIYKKLDVGYTYDPALTHARHTFLDEEFVTEYANALAENYWSFLVSKEGEFFTSDYPIVVEPHVPNVAPIYMGLAQYGAELTFPICKDIVITIWDKKYFSEKKNTDCELVLIDSKEERRQNSFRYLYAKRHVFSFHKDFSLIESYKKINGGKHFFMGRVKE